MNLNYKAPLQERAKQTQQKFLDAMEELLLNKSLGLLTIDEIAAKASLTRSAFLKRFGTKNTAIQMLYARYCDKFISTISEIESQINSYDDVTAACLSLSIQAEKLQIEDFSANRAMHELFMEYLCVDPQTQAVLDSCVQLMRKIQVTHLPPGQGTDMGAYSAAQLILTINYNHVLKAMPGLPREDHARHQLIAELVVHALKYRTGSG